VSVAVPEDKLTFRIALLPEKMEVLCGCIPIIGATADAVTVISEIVLLVEVVVASRVFVTLTQYFTVPGVDSGGVV
jgi:antibiotic biosynthesis monooxygenase (ABM) superfamily enzyme